MFATDFEGTLFNMYVAVSRVLSLETYWKISEAHYGLHHIHHEGTRSRVSGIDLETFSRSGSGR